MSKLKCCQPVHGVGLQMVWLVGRHPMTRAADICIWLRGSMGVTKNGRQNR